MIIWMKIIQVTFERYFVVALVMDWCSQKLFFQALDAQFREMFWKIYQKMLFILF